jgi:SAM-dependent methyltransferase
MKRELLIGCGSRRKKLLHKPGESEWNSLVTLDINPAHKPDVVWDLTVLPLPFEDDTFDEIHAYEVLEHVGTQGDYKLFFAQFSEFYRILKPDGHFLATVPAVGSEWVWGDPSHTRLVHPNNIWYLKQASYDMVGKTPISDFRYIYKADFDIVHWIPDKDGTFQFGLQAIKPSRIKE